MGSKLGCNTLNPKPGSNLGYQRLNKVISPYNLFYVVLLGIRAFRYTYALFGRDALLGINIILWQKCDISLMDNYGVVSLGVIICSIIIAHIVLKSVIIISL
jgi:hypothetical protein